MIYTVEVTEYKTAWKNQNGKYHREDGPAVEYANGLKAWYINGKYHREDGPAIEFASGFKEWYINDKYMTEDQFNAYINKQKEDCSGWVVEIDGVEYELKRI